MPDRWECRSCVFSCLLNILLHISLSDLLKMKLPFSTLLLFASTAVAYVNRTLTYGWGSTPAQRHYITAAQSLKVIEAAVAYSESIG